MRTNIFCRSQHSFCVDIASQMWLSSTFRFGDGSKCECYFELMTKNKNKIFNNDPLLCRPVDILYNSAIFSNSSVFGIFFRHFGIIWCYFVKPFFKFTLRTGPDVVSSARIDSHLFIQIEFPSFRPVASVFFLLFCRTRHIVCVPLQNAKFWC